MNVGEDKMEEHTYAYWRRKYGTKRKHTITREQFEKKQKWENTKARFHAARKQARKVGRVANRFASGVSMFAYGSPSRGRRRGGWM
jgi:hypothetical protein